MSSGPISVAESWSLQELLNAGWSEADLNWETALRDGVLACGDGDNASGLLSFGTCVQLARAHFEADDPRLGTSLANFGSCRRAVDQAAGTEDLLREATGVWAGCDGWVDRLTAPRSARSSMFHMRMEQLHRDTYEERWRIKWRELVDEARERMDALHDCKQCSASDAQACVARWQRECPAMLNDSRKLMAAVILLLPPG